MISKLKNRKVAAILAFTGMVIPIAGLHKFYVGQPWWGLLYVLLSWTPIPRVASAIEGVWYLAHSEEEFDRRFNLGLVFEGQTRNLGEKQAQEAIAVAKSVENIAEALRQLDRLRQEGLLSEYEFEQKRRQLLDKIA